MQLMISLKQQFSHFPMIEKSETKAFEAFCSQVIHSAILIQRIPKALLQPNERLGIEQALLLKKLIPLIPESSDFHFFQLLQHDTLQYSIESEILISRLWSDYIGNHLLQTNPTHSLYPFYQLKTLFYHPSQISGLLIALIKHNLPIQLIIDTYLFKDFFDQHAFELSRIEDACEILKARQDEHPGISELLNTLHQFSCGLEHFAYMSLDAQIHPTPLPALPPCSPPDFCSLNSQVFLHFFYLFGLELIPQVLQFDERSALYIHFQNWLPQQTIEFIQNLYVHLLNETPEEQCLKAFTRLVSITPESMISRLYENEKTLFWIFVSLKPELLQKSKNELINEAQFHAITVQNQSFVALACKKRKLETIKDQLYYELFQLQLKSMEGKETIINELYHYPNTQKWCEKFDNQLVKQLGLVIKAACENFEPDTFININDFYHQKRPYLNLLNALGYHQSKYPKDCYDFSALVLSHLYSNYQDKNLAQWLNILSYFHQSTPDFQKQYQHKILLTWLDNTHHIEIKIFAMLGFFELFQYSIKNIRVLADEKNFDIAQAAYHSPFALQCFLKLYNEEKKIKVLSQKIKKHQPILQEYCCKHPVFLNAILEVLEPESIISWLTQSQHQKEKLWFQIPLKDSYVIIQKKCSIEQIRELLIQKTNSGDNILTFNLAEPNLTKCLLDDMLEANLIEIEDIYLLLLKALNHPTTFNILYDVMSHHQIPSLLTMHNEQNLFELIIDIPEILIHILNNITPQDRAFIYKLYGRDIVLHHQHHSDILSIVFKQIPSLTLLNIALYELNQNIRIIDILVQTPDVLVKILQNLKNTHRKALFFSNDNQLLNQLSKKKNVEITKCFEYLNSIELLSFLDSDYFFHFILSDDSALYAYLENLGIDEILKFLSHKNSKGENWLQAAPIHHLTLDIILSSSPKPHQLINHALICKIINHPECLKVVLHYIPLEERGEWILSLQKFYLNNLINLESLICLISKTPLSQQSELLIIKHQTHQTIYQWLLHEFHALIQIMPYLSYESKLLLNHKIIQHKQELNAFEKNPQRIQQLFEHYNPELKFEFLLALCREYPENRIPPIIKIEIMKFAISSLDHIDSLSPRQFTTEQKKNPIWSQIKRASLFKECIIPLEIRGQELELCHLQNI